MAKESKKDKLTRKLEQKKREAQRLEALQVALVDAQIWTQSKGIKLCIVFEGRDAGGQGWRHKTHHGIPVLTPNPRHRLAKALRTRQQSLVVSTLYAAPSGGWRMGAL